jgi:hypothetical protein
MAGERRRDGEDGLQNKEGRRTRGAPQTIDKPVNGMITERKKV